MHWEKSPQSAPARSRPYQGVRVRDPVKELLRKKRSLEPQCTRTTSSASEEVARGSQSTFTPAVFGSDGSTNELSPGDGGSQCTGWKAPHPAAMTPWPSLEYGLPETVACPATTLTADLYMQTLCPSYTMLTYTHTPLLTNLGSIPVAPAQASLPQMELPDSGLTYLPWAPPLTTISTMSSPGVPFGSAALSGSPLVHVPLSMSLTTMIPQLEAQGADPQPPPVMDLPQAPEHQLDPEAHGGSLDDQLGSPNLLDKLLEERKEVGEGADKDSYSSSLFIPDL